MKKQKVFVLIKHGADNQDYSSVNVIGVYSTKTSAKERMAEEEDNIQTSTRRNIPITMKCMKTRTNHHGVAHARIVLCLMSC